MKGNGALGFVQRLLEQSLQDKSGLSSLMSWAFNSANTAANHEVLPDKDVQEGEQVVGDFREDFCLRRLYSLVACLRMIKDDQTASSGGDNSIDIYLKTLKLVMSRIIREKLSLNDEMNLHVRNGWIIVAKE